MYTLNLKHQTFTPEFTYQIKKNNQGQANILTLRCITRIIKTNYKDTHLNSVKLVDWTGRIMRDDKRGWIDNHLPPILQRLGIAEGQWSHLTKDFEKQFHQFVGDADSVKEVTLALGYQRAKGLGRCHALLTI